MSDPFSRYERSLNDIEWSSPPVRSAFSHAAYETRCANPGTDLHEQTIWNTGSDVIGPLYTAFVWWILRKAEADGIKRLYFMARDGLILKEIADMLIPAGKFDIKARYLYVSRESLLYPSIVDLDTFDLRWILWPIFRPLTTNQLLQRLRLRPDQIKEILEKHQLTDLDRPVGFREKSKFLSFLKDVDLKSLIQTEAKKHAVSTTAYLKQEGLGDGTSFALVDLGWLALSQYAISRMLDTSGIRPAKGVQGYYLGTNCLLWKYRNDTVDSFLFNSQNMHSKIALVQYELPEIFATSIEGRTLSYSTDKETVKPVVGDINVKAKEWGSERQKESALIFAHSVAVSLPREQWRENQPNENIGQLFNLFCNQPGLLEAETYGRFKHGADIEEKQSHEISPLIKFKDIPKVYSGYYWVQGCIVRSKIFGGAFFISAFQLINSLRHRVLQMILQKTFPQEKQSGRTSV